MTSAKLILGLDPGLRHTGWGILAVQGYGMRAVACGTISASADLPLPERLSFIFHELVSIIQEYQPHEAAIEETFANQNPASTLKLGFARGVVMVAPAHMGLKVAEYTANQVKKAVVGQGHANKDQVQAMVKLLLPGIQFKKADEADALAIAICHAHHRETTQRWSQAQ